MRILVTGSSGFIGRAVTAELAKRGHETVSFDLPLGDVTNPNTFVDVMDSHLDGIINLAGMLGTPELFGSEARAIKVNVIGAVNVYDFARRRDLPVVQIGTGHKGQPNPYAITKACAEELGLARAQWMGEKISVVRAYHVYGPWQPVGPPHGSAKVHKFFPTFACRSLTGMPLELCGGGLQIIDPVYVDDTAQVLVDALAGPYGEVTEAGCGREFTVKQIAEDIRYLAGSTSAMDVGPGRDGEPQDATVIAGKPRCFNPWPYKALETVKWYDQWLKTNAR